jgi:hypothetical protein
MINIYKCISCHRLCTNTLLKDVLIEGLKLGVSVVCVNSAIFQLYHIFFKSFFLLGVVTECSSVVLLGTIHKAMEYELVLKIFPFLLAYLSFSLVHVLKSSVNTPVMIYTLYYDKYIQMHFVSPTLYKYFVERCFNRGFKTLML